jgi:hypothetical protein
MACLIGGKKPYGLVLLVNDSTADHDGDGLGNLQEYALSTNPVDTDTDGDGLSDFIEVKLIFKRSIACG